MSREFPDFVDPWKAADGKRTFQGTMPIKRMQRLEPLLAPENGGMENQAVARKDAAFSARFSYDRQGLLTIRLDVEAELPLICQRSLTPYIEKIRRRSYLAVIEDINTEDLVPENYDPVWVENRRMALLDIVEEELLLAVPQVPKNPEMEVAGFSTDGEAAKPPGNEDEKTQRPFAGLADLMKTDTED